MRSESGIGERSTHKNFVARSNKVGAERVEMTLRSMILLEFFDVVLAAYEDFKPSEREARRHEVKTSANGADGPTLKPIAYCL